MFGSPDHTAYDLHFRALRIPVRVHPLFWLVMVWVSNSGSFGRQFELAAALTFVVCAFISVLVHELGHGLASRAVGDEPTGIVLYAFGGFCQVPMERQTPVQKLIV